MPRILLLTFPLLERLATRIMEKLSNKLIIAIVALGLGGLTIWALTPTGPDPVSATASGGGSGGAIATVNLPENLSDNARIGQSVFEAKCAACHGANAAGTSGLAPPLVHKYYEPSHHADEAFQRAVALGVRQHHWSFGNMPPVEGLTRGDVKMIVAYVRELQRANGIN